jgi:hypothetical protein
MSHKQHFWQSSSLKMFETLHFILDAKGKGKVTPKQVFVALRGPGD